MKQMIAGLALLALAACGGGGSVNIPSGMVAEKRSAVRGPGGCGISDAWIVREVAGVRLSQPSILSTRAAQALDSWVRRGVIPTIGRRGGGVVELKVAAHYSCRTVNSRPGARLSEHAKGNAIDISAFVLADGSRISVLNDWNGRDARVLRRLHSSGCGPFKTVIGPDGDRFHQDHFHLDAARRDGFWCR